MTLYGTIEDIRLKIKERIEDGFGSEINYVIVGRKTRSYKFDPPLVWVLPLEVPVNDSGMALNEIWDLEFLIIGITRSVTDDEEARSKAEEIAIRASGMLMVDPSTGQQDRSLDGLIIDLTRTNWSPGDSRIVDTDESLYGSAVRVKLKFNNTEVE